MIYIHQSPGPSCPAIQCFHPNLCFFSGISLNLAGILSQLNSFCSGLPRPLCNPVLISVKKITFSSFKMEEKKKKVKKTNKVPWIRIIKAKWNCYLCQHFWYPLTPSPVMNSSDVSPWHQSVQVALEQYLEKISSIIHVYWQSHKPNVILNDCLIPCPIYVFFFVSVFYFILFIFRNVMVFQKALKQKGKRYYWLTNYFTRQLMLSAQTIIIFTLSINSFRSERLCIKG